MHFPAGRTPEQQELFTHVQSLLKLRRDHPALRTGDQKHVVVGDKYYAFTREGDGERLLIVFHNADAVENINIDLAGSSIANATSSIRCSDHRPHKSKAGTSIYSFPREV